MLTLTLQLDLTGDLLGQLVTVWSTMLMGSLKQGKCLQKRVFRCEIEAGGHIHDIPNENRVQFHCEKIRVEKFCKIFSSIVQPRSRLPIIHLTCGTFTLMRFTMICTQNQIATRNLVKVLAVTDCTIFASIIVKVSIRADFCLLNFRAKCDTWISSLCRSYEYYRKLITGRVQ